MIYSYLDVEPSEIVCKKEKLSLAQSLPDYGKIKQTSVSTFFHNSNYGTMSFISIIEKR